MEQFTIRNQNKLRKGILLSIFFTLLSCTLSYSQSRIDSIFNKLDPQKFAASIKKKADKLEEKLIEKSMKVLGKMQSQEEKIYRKLLSTADSLQAKAALAGIQAKYKTLKEKLKNPAISSITKQYIPRLDSLTTSLKFLDQNGIVGNIKGALAKTQSLQDKFQQAEEIKKFIHDRKEQLKAQLEKLGLVKQVKKINKEVYYYSMQIQEYRDILKDPKRIEKKALELLAKTKFFQDFMKKNSMLASFFPMPSGNTGGQGIQQGFAGLQTRAQVTSFIQQAGMSGPNNISVLQQNIQNVQAQVTQIRNKISQLIGGGGSSLEMPDFKPNTQKVKSFLKRLEYGTDLQTQKANGYFPATSDIGLSVGYKINDKSILGIAASYKIGLGKGWNNIKFSNQGVGLRSFIDWKIKGSLWISGGYEQNYRTVFNSIDQLKNLPAWQQSGLLGMTKVVSLKTKLLKQTKFQVLWDFLSYQQKPRTQALLFRVGYSF